ncbi:hypothetical protein Tco_0668681, partial [Tanacetum coccineum]
MAVVLAVTKSKGMKVTGAVDSYLVGEDIRKVHEIRPGILCLEATGYLSDIFYDELPLKSSRNTFALLTILNEVDMNMYATGKFTIAMVDEPSSNGSATVSKRSEKGVIGIQIMFFIRGSYVSKPFGFVFYDDITSEIFSEHALCVLLERYLTEVDMKHVLLSRKILPIGMVDEPSSNGSATVSKFRCFEWICSGCQSTKQETQTDTTR